jgi:hypothetical protein
VRLLGVSTTAFVVFVAACVSSIGCMSTLLVAVRVSALHMPVLTSYVEASSGVAGSDSSRSGSKATGKIAAAGALAAAAGAVAAPPAGAAAGHWRQRLGQWQHHQQQQGQQDNLVTGSLVSPRKHTCCSFVQPWQLGTCMHLYAVLAFQTETHQLGQMQIV